MRRSRMEWGWENFGTKPQIEICEMDSSVPEMLPSAILVSQPLPTFACRRRWRWGCRLCRCRFPILKRILPIQISDCIITYDCYCSVPVNLSLHSLSCCSRPRVFLGDYSNRTHDEKDRQRQSRSASLPPPHVDWMSVCSWHKGTTMISSGVNIIS